MKEKIKYVTSGLTFRVIFGTILIIFLFEFMVSAVGYRQFTESLTQEYQDAAFRTANTATALIDADKIESYLNWGENDPEYRNILSYLDILCQKQDATFVYVISVDTSDYNHFRSVFNVVNANGSDTPWPVGYERETTNEEYRTLYRDLYEGRRTQGFITRTNALNGREPHTTALLPLQGSNGNVKGILCVERPMSELTATRTAYLRGVICISALLCVLSIVSIFFFFRHEFATPMQKIHAETQRFAAENTPLAHHSFAEISRIREIEAVGAAIEKMEYDTQNYIENLTQITAERERIGTELALASQIQAEILPNTFPPFPDRHDFDLYASMTPAKEVGGDFYDFFFLDDDRLALVMADVSGKGVPAALFMMMARLLLNTLAMSGGSPAEVLRRANETICQNNKSDMFVTVWFGVLTLSTGQLSASSAGHEYPVIKRQNGQFEIFKDKHRLALGAMPGINYLDYTLTLEKDDVLFLYTDGVPEAVNIENTPLGTDGMLTLLNRSSCADMCTLLDDTAKGITDFTGNAPQFDDVTMMAIRRL